MVNTASTETEAGPVGRQQTLEDSKYLLLFQAFSVEADLVVLLRSL